MSFFFFFFSSRRRHTRFDCDWSSDVCSSDLCCPLSTRSAPAAYSRFHRFVTDSSDVQPGVSEEKKCGWWKVASVHLWLCVARSFWSHTSCADPAAAETNLVFELSTMMCHAPRSKL